MLDNEIIITYSMYGVSAVICYIADKYGAVHEAALFILINTIALFLEGSSCFVRNRSVSKYQQEYDSLIRIIVYLIATTAAIAVLLMCRWYSYWVFANISWTICLLHIIARIYIIS